MCVSVGLEQSSKANCLHVAGVNGGGGGSTPGTGQMGRGGGGGGGGVTQQPEENVPFLSTKVLLSPQHILCIFAGTNPRFGFKIQCHEK